MEPAMDFQNVDLASLLRELETYDFGPLHGHFNPSFTKLIKDCTAIAEDCKVVAENSLKFFREKIKYVAEQMHTYVSK